MRSETDIASEFKTGHDNSPSYWRDRMLLEVLLDIRSLLSKLVSRG
jgi:hypothetical protein